MTTQPLGDVFTVEALFSASPATLQQAHYWANNGHADVAANLAAVRDATRRPAAAHARRHRSRQQAEDQLAQRFPNRR